MHTQKWHITYYTALLSTRDSLVAQTVKSLPALWEIRVWSLSWEDPLPSPRALQDSCLENPMARETWWATVPRITESQTWLSDSLSLSPEHQAWYSARSTFLWRWQRWKDLWVSSKLVIISEMKRLTKSGWDGLPGVTDLVLGVTKFRAFVSWLPVLMLH